MHEPATLLSRFLKMVGPIKVLSDLPTECQISTDFLQASLVKEDQWKCHVTSIPIGIDAQAFAMSPKEAILGVQEGVRTHLETATALFQGKVKWPRSRE